MRAPKYLIIFLVFLLLSMSFYVTLAVGEIQTPPRITALRINVDSSQIILENGVTPTIEKYTHLWLTPNEKPGDEITGLDRVDYRGQTIECLALGNPAEYWQYDKATGILVRHSEKFQYDRLLDSNAAIGSAQRIPFEGMYLSYLTEIPHAPPQWASVITDYQFIQWVDAHTIECIKIDRPSTKASSISISLDPSSVTLGKSARITGEISPARGLASVTIYYRVKGTTTWNILATTITSPGGAYFGMYGCEWTPSASGTYEIKASWSGDSDYDGAESSVQTLTVTTPLLTSFP